MPTSVLNFYASSAYVIDIATGSHELVNQSLPFMEEPSCGHVNKFVICTGYKSNETYIYDIAKSKANEVKLISRYHVPGTGISN